MWRVCPNLEHDHVLPEDGGGEHHGVPHGDVLLVRDQNVASAVSLGVEMSVSLISLLNNY